MCGMVAMTVWPLRTPIVPPQIYCRVTFELIINLGLDFQNLGG